MAGGGCEELAKKPQLTVKDLEDMFGEYKKFKKIYKPDEDPWNEEDWGYVKEHFDIENDYEDKDKFEVGDIVVSKHYPELGIGLVHTIEGQVAYIKFDTLYNDYIDIRSNNYKFLKKEKTGTMTTTTTIAFPSDFSHLLENYNYTDNSYSTQINAKPCVVFIAPAGSTNYSPFQVVNWSDRAGRCARTPTCLCRVDFDLFRDKSV